MCPERPPAKANMDFGTETTAERSNFRCVSHHTSTTGSQVRSVPLALNRFLSGSGRRSNLCAGPPCKCLLGENPQRLLRSVCFHWRWRKGAYCGKPGRCVDVPDKPAPLNKAPSGAVGVCEQPGPCEVHLLPTASRPQTQLTLPCLLSSPGGISFKHSSGAHIPQKGQKNEKPFILSVPEEGNGACRVFYRACVRRAVPFPDEWKQTLK